MDIIFILFNTFGFIDGTIAFLVVIGCFTVVFLSYKYFTEKFGLLHFKDERDKQDSFAFYNMGERASETRYLFELDGVKFLYVEININTKLPSTLKGRYPPDLRYSFYEIRKSSLINNFRSSSTIWTTKPQSLLGEGIFWNYILNSDMESEEYLNGHHPLVKEYLLKHQNINELVNELTLKTEKLWDDIDRRKPRAQALEEEIRAQALEEKRFKRSEGNHE